MSSPIRSPSGVRTPEGESGIPIPPQILREPANSLFAKAPIQLIPSSRLGIAMWSSNSDGRRLSSKATSVRLNGHELTVEKASSYNTQYRQISAVNFSDQDGKHKINISNFYLWHDPELGFDFFVRDRTQSDCLRQLIKADRFMNQLKNLYDNSFIGPQSDKIKSELGRKGRMDEVFSSVDRPRHANPLRASRRALRLVNTAINRGLASDDDKGETWVNLRCTRTGGNNAVMSIEPVSSSPGVSDTKENACNKRRRLRY